MISAENLRLRLGLAADDTGMDAVIDQLAAEALAYALAYCRLRCGEEVPEFLLTQMICEDYGRLSAAGVESRTLGGASEHYRGHYSEEVTAVLRSLRHPGGVSC